MESLFSTSAALPDQEARERFIHEINRNFSIIAPAGVGKTTAIVRRVVQIARSTPSNPGERLRKLVVVTYTNKAAQEMFERVDHALSLEPNGRVLKAELQHAFFGTIHSFCLMLLQRHGRYLGLSANIQHLRDTQAEWPLFLGRLNILEQENQERQENRIDQHPLFRYVKVHNILKLASRLRPSVKTPEARYAPPHLDLRALLQFRPKRTSSHSSAEEGHKLLRQWLESEEAGAPFNPIPEYGKGGKEFTQLWRDSFRPLTQWIEEQSLIFAARLCKRYRDYRLARGLLTYDDQIELCAELFDISEAAQAARAEEYEIILDEAQDTDPSQFRVLLALAEITTAHSASDQPSTPAEVDDAPSMLRPGGFSMVGDPQQLIYSDRADLSFYNSVRHQLVHSSGEELAFEVTFRCSEAVVAQANQVGPHLLDGANGQCGYVKLKARPEAHPGQAILCQLPEYSVSDDTKDNTDALSQFEAAFLAKWLRDHGYQGLQARGWEEVAILTPRKKWLELIAQALAKEGLMYQLHSTGETLMDESFYKWVMACATVVAEPSNHYEIVGVLRDIFGCSDDELYHFCERDGGRFQITHPVSTHASSNVAQTLNQLMNLRKEVMSMGLREGMHRLIHQLGIVERLQAIGEIEYADEKLRRLLSWASLNELCGLGWVEWRAKLLELLTETELGQPTLQGHLQLLTCHKAKGLEWDSVILPLFYRSQRDPSLDYPYIVRQIAGETAHVIMESNARVWHKQELDLRALQERQRLLYVSLTRARNTLVILDDLALFQTKGDRAHDRSFGCLIDRTLLPTATKPSDGKDWLSLEPAHALSTEHSLKLHTEPELPYLSPSLFEEAAKRSTSSWQRILPHLLQHKQHAADEEALERVFYPMSVMQKSGLDYGVWWHRMCQNIHWRECASWQLAFEAGLPFCPDSERAEKEWALFMESSLAQTIQSGVWTLHTELGLFCQTATDAYADGMMDLLLLDIARTQAWVIDWKTDRVAHPEQLSRIYGDQVRLYGKSVEKMTNFTTQAGIYSTPHGKLLEIDLIE